MKKRYRQLLKEGKHWYEQKRGWWKWLQQFFPPSHQYTQDIWRWRVLHVQRAERGENKNQARGIKWHINSNGRRGAEYIKEADENTGSVERAAGGRRKRAQHICHHLYLKPLLCISFCTADASLPLCIVHLFSPVSVHLTLSPTLHLCSPIKGQTGGRDVCALTMVVRMYL